MLKKVGMFSLMLSLVAVVAACDNDSEDSAEDEEIAKLEVTLNIPEEIVAGSAVEIGAHVTYGGEDELEADKVEFEVQLDEEEVDKIIGEHTEDGVYVIDYTFEEAGDYTVIAHTDAHHMHTMPSEEVTVSEE